MISESEEDNLKELLESGTDLNQVDNTGRSLLCNAAYEGRLHSVQQLIIRNADLEVVDTSSMIFGYMNLSDHKVD